MQSIFTLLAASCSSSSSLFGIPAWYNGLTLVPDVDGSGNAIGTCSIQLSGISDIWIVLANVIREALALAGILAVVFVIFGGFLYLTSNGNPEQTKKAGSILTNAVIGLIIAIAASAAVGFIANIFTS